MEPRKTEKVLPKKGLGRQKKAEKGRGKKVTVTGDKTEGTKMGRNCNREKPRKTEKKTPVGA